MIEILAQAFATPEVASTNVLSISSVVLAVGTYADARVWERTKNRAKKITNTVLRKQAPAPAVTRVITPAARKLHRNASSHRF